MSTRLPDKVSHVLSRQPQPSHFILETPLCLSPDDDKVVKRKITTQSNIFKRDKGIDTGFRERQTLWLPLGYLEAAELLFFSHNSAVFHIELFRYVFSCALFPKVRFPLPPMPQITIYFDCWLFLKEF